MKLKNELSRTILKTIFILFIVILIIYLTYKFSYFLAVKIGIEDKIIPACSVMVPDLRGDFKIFSGFCTLELMAIIFWYTTYEEKNNSFY